MAKIKLTKGELKRQRDSLSQFEHYLPTLQLKKQQLQMKILEARKQLKKAEDKLAAKRQEIQEWVGLLADPVLKELEFDLQKWITPQEIVTEKTNIAGANVRIFRTARYTDIDYDFYVIPLWVDNAIKDLREMVSLIAEKNIVQEQIDILGHELRVTTQRVNLFEKVKIPECRENIRKIKIYLGDQQANAVGIAKVAKGKIEAREEVAA